MKDNLTIDQSIYNCSNLMNSRMKEDDFISDLLDERHETRSEAESEAPNLLTEKEFVLQLITLYRENTNLWDVRHSDYGRKDERLKTLQKITKVLQAYDPKYTIYHLKKKINILRTNFNKERHRTERARKKGDYKREPTLWYYKELQFLANSSKPSLEAVAGDHSTVATPSASPRNTIVLVPRKKIKQSQSWSPRAAPSPRPAPSAPSPRPTRPVLAVTTETDIIGKYWAIKLKRLNPQQRRYAEKIVNDILFEGEMGNLTKNGVCIIKSSSDEDAED